MFPARTIIGYSREDARVTEAREPERPVAVDHEIEELVPVALLNQGVSPRLNGIDIDHAKMLAQLETGLPPIIVHRPTMRVIDGMHRLRATVLRGGREIGVRYFDGDENAAFVLSVESNVAHGLPLTLADRSAAAERILQTFPRWSNGIIASMVGLSAATIGALRRRSTCHSAESNTRIGRDGRTRPVSAADGRRLASALIAERPQASLREIARESGISPATAKDVRERLSRGDDPVPLKQRSAERSPGRAVGQALRPHHRTQLTTPDSNEVIMSKLRRDPSLRFTDVGKSDRKSVV